MCVTLLSERVEWTYVYFNPQVETCQEKIISLELEDPKSLESPTTPTTEDFIQAQLHQRFQLSSEDSDDNHSMVTVYANNTEDTLYLNPTDPDDFINANVFVKYTPSIIDGRPPSNLQTIVEVVNPMLAGDGTAKEITIGRSNDDASLPSFDVVESGVDDDDGQHEDSVVYRRELSINDKMKNVLAELKENEKVRLSLSRSMDEDGEPTESENDASVSYEEKTGSIGTVFMVRERLINDFYDHEDPINTASDNFGQESIDSVDNTHATVYANPGVDEFLANEIRHAQATGESDSLKSRKETLTLDLNQVTDEPENDDDDEDTTNADTPTTPTGPLGANVNGGGKKKRKKNKNKKK